MTIGINGYFLTRPYTGFGKYTTGVLSALQKIETDHSFVVFTPSDPGLRFGRNIKISVLDQVRTTNHSKAKFDWEQKRIIQAAAEQKVDLLHHFYPAASLYPKGIVQLVTIHDTTPWRFRQHMYSLKIRLFRRFIIESNRRADKIITVSKSAKREVGRVFRINPKKIRVIYNGVDPLFRTRVPEQTKKRVLKKFSLARPFIFYIGGFEVHKNVRGLVEAYATIAAKTRRDLVIAGGIFSKTRPPVYRDYFELPLILNQKGLKNKVKLIGVVSDRELAALYQSADLFAHPSLAEGFNIPLVEAMASEVAIVATDIPVNREISAKAAVLTKTKNPRQFSQAILDLLNNQSKRNSLIKKGLARQEFFDWTKTAQELIKEYQSLSTPARS